MADVYTDVSCTICNANDIRWSRVVCLVCPNYNLCRKCHGNNLFSEAHRPYHPMQSVLAKDDFFRIVGSIVPIEDDIRLCCPVCGTFKSNVTELRQHCLLKHENHIERIGCPVCVVFGIPEEGNQMEITKHLTKFHQERGDTLECDTCKASPILGTCYICLICDDYDLCESCYKRKQHNKNHMPYHPMQKVLTKEASAAENPPPQKIYRCPFCGEEEFNAKGLTDHCQQLHSHSQAIPVRCPICTVCRVPFDDEYLLTEPLLDHLQYYHGLLPEGHKPKPETKVAPLECSICLQELMSTPTKKYCQCSHKSFHDRCIREWLATNATCPVCRARRVSMFI